jgi:hypothetical protein
MSGIPDHNYPAFETAAVKLRRAGFIVYSPREVTLTSTDPEWSDWVRQDLVLMLKQCEAVATLPRWELSRGATLECHVARSLGWTVQSVGFWLGDALLPTLVPGQLLRAAPEKAPPPPPPVRVLNPNVS